MRRLIASAVCLLQISVSSAFVVLRGEHRKLVTTTTTTPVPWITLLQAKKKKRSDGDDEEPAPGMTDAFRQLESLQSLGDDAKKPSSSSISADKSVVPTSGKESLSPEKEAQVYTKMMKDLEETDDGKLYSDVMAEMGGTPSPPPATIAPPPPQDEIVEDVATPDPSKADVEKFMDQALTEALDEVKLKSSDSLSAESILNDKEIMKEIEAIFDRGNEQLMESLEEMRKEQESLAKANAESSAQQAAKLMTEEAERLAKAEASMSVMLDRVNKEAAEVEKAAQDLQKAQAAIDDDFLVKLRQGGIVKVGSLAGVLLFSLRSIADTVAAVSGGDESLLAGALVQGGIALVCAAIFFFL